MSDFNDWWEHHKDARDSLNFYDAKYVYESQQAEIDELQARIDEAIDYIAESGGVNLTSEIALNDILKGN